MQFERRHEPLVPTSVFYARVARSVGLACALLGVALGIGVLGYHALGKLDWLDALVNASMILAGMGPVDAVRTTSGKWFESAYAIFSGVVFLTSIGVMGAPVLHRFMHRFHLASDEEA
jgi:hypothetical protein